MRQLWPVRQIRAVFNEDAITVYQAYAAGIAIPAASNNSFNGTPFKLDRMTWIKPSFLWMMYRSGWATKPGQEHILAIQITRSGFEEALSQGCLSHYDPEIYADRTSWEDRKRTSPVRIQWDPERTLALQPLRCRSVQVGLMESAAVAYVSRWIVKIDDITPQVRGIQTQIAAGQIDTCQALLPSERPYPLPPHLARIIGASA